MKEVQPTLETFHKSRFPWLFESGGVDNKWFTVHVLILSVSLAYSKQGTELIVNTIVEILISI